MRRITVPLPARPYDVLVGRAVLGEVVDIVRAQPTIERVAVVTQQAVEQYAERVRAALSDASYDVRVLTVPEGERAKDLDVLGQLYRDLARIPLRRHDAVVAVGGGVVGDLAGFLAATWNRGVPVVQVPTTLLAQVDAAVGGKTGVNLPEGKNLVGAFHQPLGVVADIDALRTLPGRELRAGLGEVVKCGLIRDPRILEIIEQDPAAAVDPAGVGAPSGGGDPSLVEQLVGRSIAVKAAVVAADERESGERAHLNLGHTYGHAVEAVTGYERYLHGEAVAIGTCVALRLGVHMEITPSDLVERTERLLAALGLPTRIAPLDRDAVWAAIGRDKKVLGDVRFVLVEELGRPVVVSPPPELVDRAIDEVETLAG